MKKILIVVGTRPNFIKITQFKKVAEKYPGIEVKIVHTGQHHSENMADIFFKQFKLVPDYYLNITSSSPLKQIADIIWKLEDYIAESYLPDLIITPGDVNSTMAVAIVANKLNIKLAHLESGLRSQDREMPEEINRIITDELSDYYFVTEKSGLENLKLENKKGKSFFVGNTMIDTLVAFENEIQSSMIKQILGVKDKYILMTMHRPGNVDSKEDLKKLIDLIEFLSSHYQVIFPIHPRTVKNISLFGLEDCIKSNKNLITPEPLGYFEFQNLVKDATLVITDSGGIQEETTYRKVPCITLRPSTERPVTCEVGSNILAPFEFEKIAGIIKLVEEATFKKSNIPDLWDGKSTERIMEIISKL